MFYRLTTCACGAQKIFYGLLKSKSSTKTNTKWQNILDFGRASETKCVFFWRRLWLQKPVENFLCVARTRCEHVKHSPRLERCNAHWIRTARPTKHFLLKEKWLSSGFFKFKSLELCQTSECSIILCEIWRRLWLQTPVEKFLCVTRRLS